MSKKTILLVDDEHDILIALEMLFREEGYEVLTASNGNEALKVLSEKRPDLVVLDNMMPVLSGLQLLSKMKADSSYRFIPVILTSAARPNGSQKDYGWNEFIKKPFELNQFLDVIAKHIGRPVSTAGP